MTNKTTIKGIRDKNKEDIKDNSISKIISNSNSFNTNTTNTYNIKIKATVQDLNNNIINSSSNQSTTT